MIKYLLFSLLSLSLIILFNCERIISIEEGKPELTNHTFSPDTITYDTVVGNYFNNDNIIVDSVILAATFSLDNNYQAQIDSHYVLATKGGGTYKSIFKLKDILKDSVKAGSQSLKVIYSDSLGEIVDTAIITFTILRGIRTSKLTNLYFNPNSLFKDSLSGILYDVDSGVVDSFSITANFDLLNNFVTIIDDSLERIDSSVSEVSLKVPVSKILGDSTNVGEYNFEVTFVTTGGDTAGVETLTVYVNESFLDPYFRYCWHLDYTDPLFCNTYQIDKNAGINIKEAWKISKGEGVIVAVIDDNFEKGHEDLAANIFEVYNVNTDSNVAENNSGYPSHGSTCAGFIASPENGVGVVGVAPEAQLLLIAENTYFDYNTLKAFDYAKEKGAKVISCSWGSYDVSASLTSKLKEMYDAGITVLFANGNDSYDLDNDAWDDESEVPWVLGIGASAEDNDYTSYTNYGSNIEVIAPGGDDLGVLSIDDTGEEGWDYQYNLVNNNYAFVTGTSFATPVTAGVVALMLSANPALTPDEIRTILIETADKVGGDANYIDGFDTYRAYGKVNAEKAVKRAAGL